MHIITRLELESMFTVFCNLISGSTNTGFCNTVSCNTFILTRTMSRQVDKLFRPIYYITTICLLENININSDKHLNNNSRNKFSVIIINVIRYSFVIFITYTLFKTNGPSNNAIDFAMRVMQKLSSIISIFVTFFNADATACNLKNIQKLMSQNQNIHWNYTKWTFGCFQNGRNTKKIIWIFNPVFSAFVILYIFVVLFEIEIYNQAGWLLYTLTQYVFLNLYYVINVCYISMMYTFESIILQQFCLLNSELKSLCSGNDTKFNLVQLSRIYRNLHKQYKSFAKAFGMFFCCKFYTTHMWVVMTCYYKLIYMDSLPIVITLWMTFVSCESLLIAYYCDRIEKEVLCFDKYLLSQKLINE